MKNKIFIILKEHIKFTDLQEENKEVHLSDY